MKLANDGFASENFYGGGTNERSCRNCRFDKAGADVNAKEKYGGTPLYLAACFGHTEIALALIKAGADINAKEEYGGTPLHWAAYTGQTEIVFTLVKAGADLDILDSDGKTALQVAIKRQGKGSVIALFLQGAMEKSGTSNEQKAERLLRELE